MPAACSPASSYEAFTTESNGILAILVKEFPASDIQTQGGILTDHRRPSGQPRRGSVVGSTKASGKSSTMWAEISHPLGAGVCVDDPRVSPVMLLQQNEVPYEKQSSI
jgi:hypothetical protein